MKIIDITTDDIAMLRRNGFLVTWLAQRLPTKNDATTTRPLAAHTRKENPKVTIYRAANDYPNHQMMHLHLHYPSPYEGRTWRGHVPTSIKFDVNQEWDDVLEWLVTIKMGG